jgi:hypothetical protein
LGKSNTLTARLGAVKKEDGSAGWQLPLRIVQGKMVAATNRHQTRAAIILEE